MEDTAPVVQSPVGCVCKCLPFSQGSSPPFWPRKASAAPLDVGFAVNRHFCWNQSIWGTGKKGLDLAWSTGHPAAAPLEAGNL